MLYPAGHSALLHRISDEGLLLSEYPPGIRPARYRFLTRNRLVAALSSATVVVGPVFATVRPARRPGLRPRPGGVRGARPGHLDGLGRLPRTDPLGCRTGHPRRRIVEIIGHAGEFADEQPRPSTPLDGLSETELTVYEALPGRGARTPDQIAVAAGLPPTSVLGPLAMLEIMRPHRMSGGEVAAGA